MKDVYLTHAASFLPGAPVTNQTMIDHLGDIDGQSQRIGRLILRQNKIVTRYYVPRKGERWQYNNADMAALAVQGVVGKAGLQASDLDLLATATTQGDLLVPGHGSTVHAALAKLGTVGPLEVASFQSVCASSLMAAKTAALNIQAGLATTSVAVGSEFSSRWFQPEMYRAAPDAIADKDIRMAAEFLRWTLSDGAGAILLQDQPNPKAVSFKVEWIEMVSLAHQFDTCMYAGVGTDDRYEIKQPWSQYGGGPLRAVEDGAVMLLQDMVLLKRIIRAWVGEYLKLIDRGVVVPAKIDHLLCHYSAHSLREEIIKILHATGGMIDEENWFSNLATKGNTGSAALFVMLEEFIAKGQAKPGEQILCIVPESGRAMVGFMMLTVVGARDV
ncbi:MAG: 3-oxoacyl-[acyl-carrier-protein] synthase III C-terminal domain-containing protein [Parvularculaceae bacterium]